MKILLLGNGFDLYHKFPTRYDNFLHTVDFLQQYYDEKTMQTIGDVFGDKRLLEKDSFIPYCYLAYKEVYNNVGMDQGKIKNIISKAKKNIWFKYFLSAYNKELGWIDFEREISKVVHAFENFFLNFGNINNISFPKEAVDEYIIKKFNFFYEYKPAEMLKPSFVMSSPRNKVLNEYRLEEPHGSQIIVIDRQKIINKLYNELLELAEILKVYLDVFVNSVIDVIVDKNLITKNPVFDDSHMIVTFNYSNSFEKIYSNATIHHIHGELSGKIILGVNPNVNDETNGERYADTEFLQFKKYYQRVLNGSDIDYLKSIKEIKEWKQMVDNYSNDLYVAGHSLDVTDEDIIKEIFSLADKIVIICYNGKAIADSINNLVRIYGKREFDNLRSRTDLEFKLYSDFE